MTTTTVSQSRADRLFTILLRALYIGAFLTIAAFVVRAIPYYRLPFTDRPHHADYELFRPAGDLGHGFGIVGSALLLLLLLYSARKRSRFLARFGSLRKWLSLHIFCGVVGPLLIILHSSFKVTGLVSVSFWSMVAVASSGVFGRYLYQRIPRNVRGRALSASELASLEQGIDRELDTVGIGEARRAELERIMARFKSSRLALLFGPFAELPLRLRVRRFVQTEVRSLHAARRRTARRMLRDKAHIHRRRSSWRTSRPSSTTGTSSTNPLPTSCCSSCGSTWV